MGRKRRRCTFNIRLDGIVGGLLGVEVIDTVGDSEVASVVELPEC